MSFLGEHPETRLVITPIIAGELAAGVSLSQQPAWQGYLGDFRVLPITEQVSWYFGESYRYLKDHGLLIGSNDLWIAASARAAGVPVLTRNYDHYSRVPGIEVVSY